MPGVVVEVFFNPVPLLAALDEAWAVASTEITPIARAVTPTATGHTRDTVVAKQIGPKKTVLTGGGATRFIVGGTRPHQITAQGGVLRFVRGGEVTFARTAMHPGMKADPFLSEAARAFPPLYGRAVKARLG